MNYQKYEPHQDLESLVNFYWTLEVPKLENPQRQRIVPDGNIEMIFILGDDVKRWVSEDEFILQPRAMVLGQVTKPYYILPTGKVETFAVSFYPYGFANFVSVPISDLVNQETALNTLFDKEAVDELEQMIINAKDTATRIEHLEHFLRNKLHTDNVIDKIVKSTIDTIFSSKGKTPINTLLKNDPSKKKQLERKFKKQVGLSPKQLSKIIRLQAALKMVLDQDKNTSNLTNIAYESGFYDQSHFIRDFKEFTGIIPKEFINNKELQLSALFYSEE